jgi:hypothetical protein
VSKAGIQRLKLKISLTSALKVFRYPGYIVLAIFGALLASGLILWSLNLDLLQYIWFNTPLSVLEKLEFFFSIYRDIYTTYNGIEGTGILVFSLLFGINLALLVFVIKHQGFSSVPKKSGIGGFAVAILGGGCVACGTSILAPLLATVGATSTPFVKDLAVIFNCIGIVLISYSIYKLGELCSYIFALQKQNRR